MSAINAITTTSPAGAGVGATTKAEEPQDRFLKLLVTQMQNQDPLNPMDNAQVTTQMAQISTVSGIDKLNGSFTGIAQSFLSGQSLQAASMIGHGVLAPGSTLALDKGVASGGAQLAGAADKVSVTVLDPAGNAVKTLDLGARPAGPVKFTWDGGTDKGGHAPDGSYSFAVTAQQAGQKVGADPLAYGTVGSVSVGARELTLDVKGLGQIGLSQVKQIL